MIEKFATGFIYFLTITNEINVAPFLASCIIAIVIFFIRNIIIYLCR